MKRFTVSVSKAFKAELDRHPTVNWPQVMKQGILNKLKELEEKR